jgi:hypothetical protein
MHLPVMVISLMRKVSMSYKLESIHAKDSEECKRSSKTQSKRVQENLPKVFIAGTYSVAPSVIIPG